MLRAFTYLVQLSAFGAVYFFTARVSLDLASVYPSATAIWPPAGFALAAVLFGGYRAVPAIFGAAFLVDALSSGSSYAAAATAGGNAFEAFAGGFLVNHWAEGRNAFAAPTRVAKFLLIAIFVTAVNASVGAAVNVGVGTLSLAENINWGRFASIWFPLWLGDLAAVHAGPCSVDDGPSAVIQPSAVIGIGRDFCGGKRLRSGRIQLASGRDAEQGAIVRSCHPAAAMGGVAPRST